MHLAHSHFYRHLVSLALFFQIAAICTIFHVLLLSTNPPSLWGTGIFWNLAAMIAIGFCYINALEAPLFSIFTLSLSIRVASINTFWVPTLCSASALFVLFILFVYIAYVNTHSRYLAPSSTPAIGIRLSTFEWQLTFIRIYLGLTLLAHSGEKLFAGVTHFHHNVITFSVLGLSHPAAWVIVAGLCEFAGALGLTFGFLTRLSAIGSGIYILVASFLGHHFAVGFIWANRGGGWEYPVLWVVLILSFTVAGAGRYSIDACFQKYGHVPAWIQTLMGKR